MKAWRRILVPTDFSPCSGAALREALDLAGEARAAVEVVHVIPLAPAPPHVGLGALVVESYGVPQQVRANAERRLESWLRDCGATGLQWRVVVGDPAREIVDLTSQEGADLVVLGTHGRTGLSHFFLGSVAERVVREAACPVLTVHAEPAASVVLRPDPSNRAVAL